MARWPEAQAHFEAALAMNERIGARVSLAHTQHDYAAMLVARGEAADRERAATLLRASLESAREIGMRALEERVTKRLNELAGVGGGVPDDLTAREAEVLRLIAIGPATSRRCCRSASTPWRRTSATFSPRPAAPTARRPPPTLCAAG